MNINIKYKFIYKYNNILCKYNIQRVLDIISSWLFTGISQNEHKIISSITIVSQTTKQKFCWDKKTKP